MPTYSLNSNITCITNCPDSDIDVSGTGLQLSWGLNSSIVPELADDYTATFARSTAGTYIDIGGVMQIDVADVARFEANGFLCEPQRINKCENYNIIGEDQYSPVLNSGSFTKGKVYEIVTHTDQDYTADGAADNNPGTSFVATGTNVTLDANNTCKEIGGTDLTDDSFVSGSGTGAKAYHDGSAFQNPIPGTTLTGNAAATLEIIDDQTALEAVGLGVINSAYKVYKLDNSGGDSPAIAHLVGQVGNTNIHTGSIYARGDLYVNIGGSYGDGVSTSGSIYLKYTTTTTPTSTSQILIVQAPPGNVGSFTLNQLEEGSAATSVIITQGVATTRTADDLRLPVADGTNFNQGEGTLLCDWTPKFDAADISSDEGIVSTRANATSLLSYDGTNLSSDDGTNTANKAKAAVSGITQKIAVRWSSELNEIQIIVDGSAGTPSDYDDTFDLTGALYRIRYGLSESSKIKNISVYSVDKGLTFCEKRTTLGNLFSYINIESTTPDADLSINRSLSSTITNSTDCPNNDLSINRILSSNITNLTNTTDSDLEIERQLLSNIVVATNTIDARLKFVRDLEALISIQTITYDLEIDVVPEERIRLSSPVSLMIEKQSSLYNG